MNPELKSIIEGISNNLDADIFLFNSEINLKNIDKIACEILSLERKRSNLILILTTLGGNPDEAYRIVRFIKRKYEKLILYIFGHCKSAGTLLALGADEIVMSDFGELGPLDIQLIKDDELTRTSGLNHFHSLLLLNTQAFGIFEDHFLRLKERSSGTITTKIAAEIASSLVVGLFSPISAQIDPIKLGEVNRANNIALDYGLRICENQEALLKLCSEYPSHSFVIDITEAKEILDNVREPTDLELKLSKLLFDMTRMANTKKDMIVCLYPFNNNHKKEKKDEKEFKSDGQFDKRTTKENKHFDKSDEQELLSIITTENE